LSHLREITRAAYKLLRRRDLVRRWRLLVALQRWLRPDVRMPDPDVDWYRDPEFTAYLERFDEIPNFNAPRRWNLYQLLRLSLPVEGDTAECGSFIGAGSWLICRATRGTGKQHHVFDSFEGVSKPGARDGKHWKTGALAMKEQVVRDNLRAFPDVQYYPGWIPERFDEIADRRFSFVHIDVDLEQPTRDSLEFFYPRMNPGGILICDDYGSSLCPGATLTTDEFLANQADKMMALSPGGGFLIRGVPSPAVSVG